MDKTGRIKNKLDWTQEGKEKDKDSWERDNKLQGTWERLNTLEDLICIHDRQEKTS